MGKRKSVTGLAGLANEPKNKMSTISPLSPRINTQTVNDFIEEVESVLTLANPPEPHLAPIFTKGKLALAASKKISGSLIIEPLLTSSLALSLPPPSNSQHSLSATPTTLPLRVPDLPPMSKSPTTTYASICSSKGQLPLEPTIVLSNRFELLGDSSTDKVIQSMNTSRDPFSSVSGKDPTDTLIPFIPNPSIVATPLSLGVNEFLPPLIRAKIDIRSQSISTQTPIWESYLPPFPGSYPKSGPCHLSQPSVLSDITFKIYNIQQDLQKLLDSLRNYSTLNPSTGHIPSLSTECHDPSKTHINLVSVTQPPQSSALFECSKRIGATYNDGFPNKVKSGPTLMYKERNDSAYQETSEELGTHCHSTKRILYLSNVPKLVRPMVESNRSLLDKVLYHFRITRRCLAVVRSDISGVRRFSSTNNNTDVVEVCFTRPFFVEELINLEQRIQAHDIPLPSTVIVLRLHLPEEFYSVPLLGNRRLLGSRGSHSGNLDEVD